MVTNKYFKILLPEKQPKLKNFIFGLLQTNLSSTFYLKGNYVLDYNNTVQFNTRSKNL